MLNLNVGIYSQIDAYSRVYLRAPNAGTVRIPLYGAQKVFESNITLRYCRSFKFLENTSPSLHFFSSQAYLQHIMFNLFFFHLLQVVIKFPWFEKQSVQAELISLVRQTNVQKKLDKFP